MPAQSSKRKVTPGDERIGENIRKYRMLKGWSQAQLGEQFSKPVTFQQVQKYENGANRVSGSRLIDMAQLFGVTIDQICGHVRNGEPLNDPLSRLGTDRAGLDLATAFDKIKSPEFRRVIASFVNVVATHCGDQ